MRDLASEMKRLFQKRLHSPAAQPVLEQSSSPASDELQGRAGSSLPPYESVLLPDRAGAVPARDNLVPGNRWPASQAAQGTRSFDVD